MSTAAAGTIDRAIVELLLPFLQARDGRAMMAVNHAVGRVIEPALVLLGAHSGELQPAAQPASFHTVREHSPRMLVCTDFLSAARRAAAGPRSRVSPRVSRGVPRVSRCLLS